MRLLWIYNEKQQQKKISNTMRHKNYFFRIRISIEFRKDSATVEKYLICILISLSSLIESIVNMMSPHPHLDISSSSNIKTSSIRISNRRHQNETSNEMRNSPKKKIIIEPKKALLSTFRCRHEIRRERYARERNKEPED